MNARLPPHMRLPFLIALIAAIGVTCIALSALQIASDFSDHFEWVPVHLFALGASVIPVAAAAALERKVLPFFRWTTYGFLLPSVYLAIGLGTHVLTAGRLPHERGLEVVLLASWLVMVVTLSITVALKRQE